jgi:hypothetical protein
MRGKRAKELRKAVYGDLKKKGCKYSITEKGEIISDYNRQSYKKAKKQRKVK